MINKAYQGRTKNIKGCFNDFAKYIFKSPFESDPSKIIKN